MLQRCGTWWPLCLLLKAATSEVWWPENADHICFIRGRIGFDVPKWFVPADEKQKPTGAFLPGQLLYSIKHGMEKHLITLAAKN